MRFNRSALNIVALCAITSIATLGLPAHATHEKETRFLDSDQDPEVVDVESTCCPDGWNTGAFEINGDVYAHTLAYDYMQGGETVWVEYNLGRDWTGFEATLGQRDDSETGQDAIFEIYGDGDLLSSKELGLGEAVPVEVDVTGILRLRVSVTGVDNPDGNTIDFIPAFGTAAVTRPKAHHHARSVSLTIKGRAAHGTLKANDAFDKCTNGVTVKIQRKGYDGWTSVARATTNSAGEFSGRVPKGGGKYRALAPRQEFGDTYPEDVCLKAKSKPINR